MALLWAVYYLIHFEKTKNNTMKTESIIIANLSCGGCIKTITKKISALTGVNHVNVNLETNEVIVNTDESTSRELICKTLLDIGYPENTEQNNLITQLKSVKSCLTGKLS